LFSIIDIETTGNNTKYGKITEFALYQFDGQKITKEFSTLLNPEMDIPFYITKLTGINNEMVKDAPRFHEVARTIVELTAGRTFVAHNVSFDYNFVKKEFERLGYNFNRKTICTVKLARKLIPGHSSYSLGKLCSDLGIEIKERHRAAGDAFATVKLFKILLQKNELIQNTYDSNNIKLF